jgi:hypothetical protein
MEQQQQQQQQQQQHHYHQQQQQVQRSCETSGRDSHTTGHCTLCCGQGSSSNNSPCPSINHQGVGCVSRLARGSQLRRGSKPPMLSSTVVR